MTTELASAFSELQNHLNQRIIGQTDLVNKLLIALLADGHLLVEGAHGLAKTTAIKALAEGVVADFHRVQFTPDLLPSDLIGTDIFDQKAGQFEFQQGPLFHNLVLADEINRAPAKVQSALLEAMAERQITVGQTTYDLPPLYLVMATQNPIEQEGTYPLPEAQLDRFLLYVDIDFPDLAAERDILKLARGEAKDGLAAPTNKLNQEQIFAARQQVLDLHVSAEVDEYLLQLVMATRNPSAYNADLARWISSGASPRATIALDRCARANAWLAGRDYVSPSDVQMVARDVLRHRVLLSFEAEAEGKTGPQVVDELLTKVPAP